MAITLIGYRGSGKTTLAKPLAARLGWQWIDADAEIEQRAGMSIREIFDSQGEPAFRELERQVMADQLKKSRLVIAAGGGAILNESTRSLMRLSGPVVWLRASVESLAHRIDRDASSVERRPNLTATGGTNEIRKLLEIREPLYRDCANLIVDTDELPLEQIVDLIQQRVSTDWKESAAQ